MASNNENNPQEEIRGIENLDAQLTSAGNKLADNKKIIYWATGAVVIIGALLAGYFFLYRNPNINKSFEAYNQVEIDAAGNDSVAAVKYLDVAKKYSGTDAGKLAGLNAAEVLYNQGKYKEAIKALDGFSSGDAVLEANATILKGDCYVNTNNYAEALKCFDQAISIADRNPQIVPRVLLKEANIYDAQKKYADALKCYEQIKTEYPECRLGGGLTIDAYIEREKARIGK